MDFHISHFGGSIATGVAIVLAAFVSEDATTITAASLAAGSLLDVRFAFLSAFAGLWAGDLVVYAVVRFFTGQMQRLGWLAGDAKLQALNNLRAPKEWALALSRFFPGTRLPAYVAAGLRRMPFCHYAGITALTAMLWTAIVFVGVAIFPSHATTAATRITKLSIAGLGIFGLLLIWRHAGVRVQALLQHVWQRLTRWEFWPAWLFYAPVTAMCAWLGIRYQGLSLPTIANRNQKNGGIIGESKIEILHQLMRNSPEATAPAYLIAAGEVEGRIVRIESVLQLHGIAYPFVLKPDVAQRGAGYHKVRSPEDARDYLRIVTQPLVLQRYAAGPNEAGIFYYRFPGEARGQIFGITRKRFPEITGDGVHSVEQLIARDERARFLKNIYVKRLGADAGRVPAEGEKVRLVDAGNHCQGCIFEDGWDLYSEKLREAIDDISRPIAGFHVGRFDLRYADDEELRAGKGFQVIELNGAGSEATNLYDAKNSLWNAYGTLYRQWKLIYAIGAENRKLGAVPRSVLDVWRDWREYSARASEFPIAD
jgi:membrane protein DedA with SNARE-associated domain